MYVQDFGISITPGEGVEDITQQFLTSGQQQPKPGTSPAKSQPEGKVEFVDTLGPVPDETVLDETQITNGNGGYVEPKSGEKVWYRSPWLWGGVAVLAVAGVTAAVYMRRRRAF